MHRLVIALIALWMFPVALHAQGTDPVSVLQASDAAYNAHDLEAISALFADDAVRQLIPPPSPDSSGTWRGKQEIRTQWQREFALNSRVERIGEYQASGDTVTGQARYRDDSLIQLGVAPIEYTIQVTVKNGKITSSIVTTTPESLAKIQAAVSRLPATGATGNVAPLLLLLLGGLGLIGLGIALRSNIHRMHLS
jgi:hypothetical protein